jgi:SpoVK/Ycf46/Vps4 family AAA+-type ATPase
MAFVAPRALAFALCAWIVAVSPPAHAKAVAQSPYSLKQTFGAALRLLRVDLSLEVTEKDEEAAYLLFQYRLSNDPKRVVAGAVELVALENEVRIIVKIPTVSEAHERILRDRLMKKMREDYGEPPKRKPVEKPTEPTQPKEPNTPSSPDDAARDKPAS